MDQAKVVANLYILAGLAERARLAGNMQAVGDEIDACVAELAKQIFGNEQQARRPPTPEEKEEGCANCWFDTAEERTPDAP